MPTRNKARQEFSSLSAHLLLTTSIVATEPKRKDSRYSQQCVYAGQTHHPRGFLKMQLHVSDMAPPFSTLDDEGKKVSLGDYMGKTNIVLYFYPKDFTMGCTKESCTFRDRWDDIRALGAVVLGISSDGEESHREFKKKYSLPFTLLSDPGQEIRNLYGVKGRYLPLPSRVTFVIDRDGKIRDIFNSQLNVSKHVENALEVLKRIRKEEEDGKQAVQKTPSIANPGGNTS